MNEEWVDELKSENMTRFVPFLASFPEEALADISLFPPSPPSLPPSLSPSLPHLVNTRGRVNVILAQRKLVVEAGLWRERGGEGGREGGKEEMRTR